jgi:hypothetical protein
VTLFNRVVVSFLLLALASAAVAVIALAWAIPDESIRGLRDAVDWLGDNNEDLQKVALTSGGALVALVSLTLLVFELMPAAPTAVKVADVTAGDAVLSTVAIGQRVEEAVREVPNVSQVRTSIKTRRAGSKSLSTCTSSPRPTWPRSPTPLASCAQVLSERLHVALAAQPRVRLHYRELQLRQPAAPRPAPAGPRSPAPAPPRRARSLP